MRYWEALLVLSLYKESLWGSLWSSPLFDVVVSTILFTVHLVVENLRWQLVPAYVALILLYLFESVYIRYFCAVLTTLSFLFGWVLFPVFRLQPPDRCLGCKDIFFHFKVEDLHNNTNKEKNVKPTCTSQMRTRVWYPSKSSSQKKCSYFSKKDAEGMVLNAISPSLPRWLFSHMTLVKTNSSQDVPISDELQKWPLVLLSHGLTGIPEVYSSLAENLCGKGFIVAAPVHTDGSSCASFERFSGNKYPDNEEFLFRNRQLRIRSANILNVLQKLQGDKFFSERIDFSRVAVCGHSFGGCTAFQVLCDAAKQTKGNGTQSPIGSPRTSKSKSRGSPVVRPIVGASWDGWFFPVSPKLYDQNNNKESPGPFLCINSDLWQWKENLERMRKITELPHSSKKAKNLMVAVKSTSHHNFNDVCLFSLRALLSSRNLIGKSPKYQVHETTSALTAAFFIHHLGLEKMAPYSNFPTLKQLLEDNFIVHYQ